MIKIIYANNFKPLDKKDLTIRIKNNFKIEMGVFMLSICEYGANDHTYNYFLKNLSIFS